MPTNNVETINRILELAPLNVVEVQGFTYLDKDKAAVLFQPPAASALKVVTLTGLVALLEAGVEEFAPESVVVHVESHENVKVLSKVSDIYGRRISVVHANRVAPERQFQFNTYMPQESFVIALASLFVQDDDLRQLVALAGNLAAKAEVKQEDDGFTQAVTTKAGVHRLTESTVKPRVTLTPFRTFLEAQQPASEYVFRVKADADRGSLCALFDADAGNWKLEAIQNVRTWLESRLKGSTVLGLPDIPVIA